MKDSLFGSQCDNFYMNEALNCARMAAGQGEVPVGAVVVDQRGCIIAQGYNMVEVKKTQSAHAEMIALKSAAQTLGDWRLDGCSLYVTLEPCVMCIGMIRLSRIGRLVYGASSPLFGFRLDNQLDSWVYNDDTCLITGGVMAEESGELMKSFFRARRKKEL